MKKLLKILKIWKVECNYMIMKMDLVITFTNNKLSIKVGKKWKKI